MIAEEIIAGYLRIRDFLKLARNSYLKKKSKHYAETTKKQALILTKKIGCSPTLESNRQKLKLYKAYV
jgi:hypothetical protein